MYTSQVWRRRGLMAHILIIDADPALGVHLATQLREQGHRVATTEHTEAAERLLTTEHYDLTLLDVQVEFGKGWALLAAHARSTPMMVVSSAALEEDVVRGFELGAIDFLPRPFRSAELMARLNSRLAASTPAAPASKTRRTKKVEAAAVIAPAPISEPLPPDLEPLAPPVPLVVRRTQAPLTDEERLFIPHGEEVRLLGNLREEQPEAELSAADLQMLPLAQRLRAARQRRRTTLVQTELDTRVRMYYIQAMEDDKFSLLPRGPLADGMVRRYAAYLGLDAETASAEFRRNYAVIASTPTTEVLGGPPSPTRLPVWPLRIAAAVAALALGIGGIVAIDPQGAATLGARARAIVIPPTATPTASATAVPPTSSATRVLPTPTPMPTLTLTTTPTASATLVPPTSSPVASATPVPPSATATLAPRRPVATRVPPTPVPPTRVPSTPEPPTPLPPTPVPPIPELPTPLPQP